MSVQTSGGLIKRTGTISNYQAKRAAASFVFTDSDQTKLGAIAIAAGLAGLGGQAVATASYAASAEEDADYVEFDLDGQPVKGWVWRSPFKDGDEVEVVGEIHGGYLDAGAIARPADRIIALYPHCSRGIRAHVRNAIFWWASGTTGVLLVCFLAMTTLMSNLTDAYGEGISMALSLAFFLLVPLIWVLRGSMAAIFAIAPLVVLGIAQNASEFPAGKAPVGLIVAAGVYAFFALMTISLTRKWMPFVRVAEKVFKALGWPNPSNVDLVKSSKAQRRPDDPGEFGTFYFRY